MSWKLKNILDYCWKLRVYAKRDGVILIFVALLATGVWFLAAAWQEQPIDVWTNFKSENVNDIYNLRTIITLDSLDPDTSTVTAHISTRPNDFLFDSFATQQFLEFKTPLNIPNRSNFVVYYQKPEIVDLSTPFELAGLLLINQDTDHADFDRVKSSLEVIPPPDRSSVLSVIGNPRMFPFDQYMVLLECTGGDAFVEYKNKIAHVDAGFSFVPRFPGLVVHEMSQRELESRGGRIAGLIGKSIGGTPTFNPAFWQNSAFAIVIERSLYLRVLTIILGIAAVFSTVFVYILSVPSKYYLNSLGNFAALWGVRSILTVSAPKSPNLIDFTVLVLFILQVILVTWRAVFSRKKSTEDAPSSSQS